MEYLNSQTDLKPSLEIGKRHPQMIQTEILQSPGTQVSESQPTGISRGIYQHTNSVD